jgi:hypothetical protein
MTNDRFNSSKPPIVAKRGRPGQKVDRGVATVVSALVSCGGGRGLPDLCGLVHWLEREVSAIRQSLITQLALLAQVWLTEEHASDPSRTLMPSQDDIVASRASANKAEKG